MNNAVKIRACGGCTLCCFTHAVGAAENILTAAFEWCAHCEIGMGCRTYGARPRSCAIWRCAWLEGEGGDDERPDTLGFVSHWSCLQVGKTLVLVEGVPGAIESSYAHRITAGYAKQGVPVLRIRADGANELIFAHDTVVFPSVEQQARREGIAIIRI